MSFFGDKKRAESMLFGPKYEELVAKFLTSKNRSKELFGLPKKIIQFGRFEVTFLKRSPIKS